MTRNPVPIHVGTAEFRARILGPLPGTITDVGDAGQPSVVFEGAGEPVVARFAASLDINANSVGQSVILTFENGDARYPVIVDFIRSAIPKQLAIPADAAKQQAFSTSFELNGKRVVLEGKDEIVLRCGLGSLTIRADGQVVIKGTRLMSKASEMNKIRGSSVSIN